MRYALPLALVAALAAGCSSEPSQRSQAQPATPPPAASPEPSPPSEPAASPSAATVARAVYWLGATKEPRGPKLYREFVRRPAAAEPVRDAVEAMLTLEPNDPDYDSLWAEGTKVRDVRREGTTAVVDLSQEATRNGGGSAFEAMTLQQLVHTVTAADTTLRDVRLLVEGKPVETLWGSADASKPMARGLSYEVLGPVWLDVQEGGTLDGEFGGSATVFEATVNWDLRQGERVVQEGFSTATEGAPGRGTWTGTADVPPGDYELRAYETSAKDGSLIWMDTKRVTVPR